MEASAPAPAPAPARTRALEVDVVQGLEGASLVGDGSLAEGHPLQASLHALRHVDATHSALHLARHALPLLADGVRAVLGDGDDAVLVGLALLNAALLPVAGAANGLLGGTRRSCVCSEQKSGIGSDAHAFSTAKMVF